MKTPTPEEAAAATNREIFQGLAKILAMLATRMQTQDEAATQIALLVPRAEELAAQARALAIARIPDSGGAAALAAQLEAFTADTEKLAQRAGREAAASRTAGAILKGQAAELTAVARALDGVNDRALIRTRLRSVLDTLAALPARLQAVTAVAADVASLGDTARDLADSTKGLQAARNPSFIVMAIYRGLRDFADTAASIAASMADDAERVRQSIGSKSDRAIQLGSTEAALAGAGTAIGRMQAVVTRGAAAQRTPQPAPGVVWGR